MSNEIVAAYVAGIIDGEGHLSIERHKSGWMFPSVRVSNSEQELSTFLQGIYGGSIQASKFKENCRTNYMWVLTGILRVGALHDAVAQYSVIKKSQWALIQQFVYGEGTIRAFKNEQLSPEERSRRVGLKIQLQALTKRGTK